MELKFIVFRILLLLSVCSVSAQVGVGTTTPKASLEVSNVGSGGVLIPSYSLTGNTDATTVVNPQDGGAPIEGTIVYNTADVTSANPIKEGFVFWDGNRWREVGNRTKVMMRSFASGTSTVASTFNFSNVLFNNIDGTSLSGTTLTLPRGIYKLTSNIRLSSNGSVDWNVNFLSGITGGSAGGSIISSNQTSNATDSQQSAVFEVTAATGTINFTRNFLNGSSNVFAGQCYMILEKLD